MTTGKHQNDVLYQMSNKDIHRIKLVPKKNNKQKQTPDRDHPI